MSLLHQSYAWLLSLTNFDLVSDADQAVCWLCEPAKISCTSVCFINLQWTHSCEFLFWKNIRYSWASNVNKEISPWSRRFHRLQKNVTCPILISFSYLFCWFFFVDETFARLVDNYMRPAIHKGVPPLFNNIRNLYSDKEKVILRSFTPSGFSSNFKVDSLPTEFCM